MRLFGTDGIRAPFGQPPLDQPTVTALGFHLGQSLAARTSAPGAGGPPAVILGGDTRDSTPTLIGWLASGLSAAGARPRNVGTIPTPGVAFLVRDSAAAAGVAVSASHNPHPDNGIKILDAEGFKASPETEADLEARLATDAPSVPPAEPEDAQRLVARYLAALRASVGGAGERPLTGLSVVLDPGHGAASPFAGPLFEQLGAEVAVIHAHPDGANINRDSGSTRPEALTREVVRRRASLGVAFDGDADRAILVDETGEIRDGDAILYLWARGLHAEGRLEPPQVVATTMSNLGLERALARDGIGLVRCDVGDRWVVETLRRRGLRLGGEQSGHIIDLDLATTGDGLLTGLQVAARVAQARRCSLSGLLEGFRRYPQVLVNVRVREKPPLDEVPAVRDAAQRAATRLGDDGRLVLRYSGTEPLARVMIEGREQTEIESLAGEIAAAIRAEIGAREGTVSKVSGS